MKHHIRTSLVLALTAALLSGTALSGTAWADPAPVLAPTKDADGKPLPFGRPAYQKPDVPLGTGPYKAIMAEDPSLPDHTLYYPADMAAAGKLPIITWGNGACLNAGNRFRIALTEMASHGFLIVAGGPIDNAKYEVGPQENPPVTLANGNGANAPRRPPPPPQAAPKPGDAVGRNTVPQLIAGIDWAVKENERQGSKFYHRLDTQAIGVAGQSCGGMLATQVSADPRIKATVLFSGVPFLDRPVIASKVDPKAQLAAIHAPVLILAGDAGHDILHQASIDDLAYIKNAPVFMAWQDGLTHIGTYGMKNGGELTRLGWEWFAWQLRHEQKYAAVFRGADCALCKEGDGWHVERSMK
ncbi:MAG TPA: dienelactone hydrolase family protein [Rhizomicrobium sp.]|nr:dienelactone hydrolase family protein [Rhizomicrobium sp.]